jgi:hypothetical protein
MKNQSEHLDGMEAETKTEDSTSAGSSSHAEAGAADKAYWLTRTPQERLRHMEVLRRMKYGARATEGIKRVIKIVKLRDT